MKIGNISKVNFKSRFTSRYGGLILQSIKYNRQKIFRIFNKQAAHKQSNQIEDEKNDEGNDEMIDIIDIEE